MSLHEAGVAGSNEVGDDPHALAGAPDGEGVRVT
jgi:hypothetical protein